jgi:large subunit ribosomal protein L13
MKKKIKPKIVRKVHHLDAENNTAGRLASLAAILLMGKHKSDWQPHLDIGDFVEIENIKKINFSGKKLKQKIYYRVSGYLGGIKSEKLEDLIKKDPGKLFKKIVYNMLPKNRLRSPRLKRLKIK